MVFQITQNPTINIVLFILILLIASRILVWILKTIIGALVSKTKTNVDDLILARSKNFLVLLFFFIGIKQFILPLITTEFLTKLNDSIIYALGTLVIIVVIDVIIDNWGKEWAKKTESTADDALLNLFHKFAKVIIGIIGLIIILGEWGVQITPLLASLGVAGLVLGLALKDTLANIFGGIAIILDKNFSLDDTIKLQSGEMGKIIDIGLRSTKIRTFDNELLIIPNNNMANAIIQNYAKPQLKAREVIDFGVAYGSDTYKVRKVVLQAVKKIPKVLKDPEPSVKFMNMGDFALQFKAYFWVQTYKERFDAKIKAVDVIYKALNKAKIDIPFPTSTVYVKK